MDVFLEYLIKRKYTSKEYIKVILFGIGSFVLAILLFLASMISYLYNPFLQQILFVALIADVYFGYVIVTRQNVEYEYIVTNGELDVDSIVNRRKRKRLITVHSRTFDIVAPVGDARYRNEENANFTRVIDASSRANNGKAYFAVFSKDGQKIKLVFEPTEKMLEAFKTFVPRNVFMREM